MLIRSQEEVPYNRYQCMISSTYGSAVEALKTASYPSPLEAPGDSGTVQQYRSHKLISISISMIRAFRQILQINFTTGRLIPITYLSHTALKFVTRMFESNH